MFEMIVSQFRIFDVTYILPLYFCLSLSLCPYLFHRQYAKTKLIFAIHPRDGVLLECFAKTTRDGGGGGVAVYVLIIFARRRRYPMVQSRKIIASTQTRRGTLTSTSYTEWATVKNNGTRARFKVSYDIINV